MKINQNFQLCSINLIFYHIYTHTYAHTHKHIRTQSHSHKHTHKHIHMHTHKCKKTNTHTYTQTHTDIYAQTVTHNTQEVVVTACINYVTLCNQLLRLLQHTALCILRVNYYIFQ